MGYLETVSPIDALLAAGRYADAARELRRLGDLERAQALYEKIWDFRTAAEVARERGDRPTLLRLLLEARDFNEARRVGHELADPERAAPGEQARAADVYERHRLWAEAATLREALGQLDRAHELFLRAQLPLEAARLDETLGRTREAGIAYERYLAAEPDSPEAPRAHLFLGRLLAGFQRHEEAVRHLQRAARESGHGQRRAAPAGRGAGGARLSRRRRGRARALRRYLRRSMPSSRPSGARARRRPPAWPAAT